MANVQIQNNKITRIMIYCSLPGWNEELYITMLNDQLLSEKITRKLEILLKKHTHVNQSSAQFEIKDVATIGSKAITLAELEGLEQKDEYERVTVRTKVFSVQHF